jgi:NADPH:quinone reductase-like Zn-dependent oxidoreductase
VLDIAGNPSLRQLRQALKPRGTAVFVGGEGSGVITGMGRQMRGVLISPFLKQRLVLLVAKERASDYERLTDLIESGQITPSLDRTYPLDGVPHAMQQLETGQVRGKIAITPRG